MFQTLWTSSEAEPAADASASEAPKEAAEAPATTTEAPAAEEAKA
jgi:hypothetical protein